MVVSQNAENSAGRAAPVPGTAEGAAGPDFSGEEGSSSRSEEGSSSSRAEEESSSSRAEEESSSSRAEEEGFLFPDEELPAAVSAPGSAFAIFRMILVLALVAAVIYLVVFFLRRLSRPQVEQNPHLKILASTHLGSGRFLHVVSLGTQAWLVGSGEGGISRIADITDKEAVDAMALDASKKSAETPESGPFPAFQALLKKFSGGVSGQEQNRLESMRKRRERFKRF